MNRNWKGANKIDGTATLESSKYTKLDVRQSKLKTR